MRDYRIASLAMAIGIALIYIATHAIGFGILRAIGALSLMIGILILIPILFED